MRLPDLCWPGSNVHRLHMLLREADYGIATRASSFNVMHMKIGDRRPALPTDAGVVFPIGICQTFMLSS